MPKSKTYTVSSKDELPFIRLTGKWLVANGINVGDKLELVNSKNMVILTKMSKRKAKQMIKDFEIKQLQQKLNDLI